MLSFLKIKSHQPATVSISGTIESKREILPQDRLCLRYQASRLPINLPCKEAFAEVSWDDKWVKVELLERNQSLGNWLVERIDGCGSPFEVNTKELSCFGSHDPETK